MCHNNILHILQVCSKHGTEASAQLCSDAVIGSAVLELLHVM